MKNSQSFISRVLSIVAFVLICVVGICVFDRPVHAQSGGDEFRPGEVLVEIKPGASIDEINARFGTTTLQRIYGTNFFRLRTPNGKKEAKFRKRLSRDVDVLSAALNPIINTPVNVFGHAVIGFPGDRPGTGQTRVSYLTQQLFDDLQAIQVRAVGTGVIVALVDTGIDRNHPDIKDHIWTDTGEIADDNLDNDNDGLIDDVYGWNFLEGNNNTLDQRVDSQTSISGHGTFIAGLIGLVAPGAKIMPIRAFSSDGVSDAFTVSQGIKYAVDHGARVINLSFGSTEDSQVMHEAITYAKQRGVLLVAAVGNENKGNDVGPQFPANWNLEVMGVAAIDNNDRKASFSNFGTNVSVVARGVNLISLYPELNDTPDYAVWSGTSFAAPLASAEAALILEGDSRRDARTAIENSAIAIDNRNPGLTGKLGKGRIDPLRALQSFNPATSNRSEIVLLPTSVEPAAHGKAEVSVAGTSQEFEVEAEQLQPRASYKLVVDGNVIVDSTNAADPNRAFTTATNFGTFKIEFSTTPSDNHPSLPAALNPVTGIKKVEVRDSQDRIVISNTFAAPAPGPGGGGTSVEKEATLQPTGVIPRASGRARAEVEPEREKLRVEGDGLVSGVVYSIFADGSNIGSGTAQSDYFRVEFTSDGSSGVLLPASVRPVTAIQVIEIRNPGGQAVLRGSFQSGGDDFGGGHGGGSQQSFQGQIESLPAGGLIGDWQIAGRTVHVSLSTEIRQDKGPAVVGAQVKVDGTLQPDGSVTASRVEVQSAGGGGGGGSETSFKGTIQSLPSGGLIGDWRVGGILVHVFGSTEIRQDKGQAVVGAQVEVKGVVQPDGSYNANRVEVQ
jgi:subtilisin family serine protease